MNPLNVLNRMKIGAKLMTAFVVVGVICGVVGLIGYMGLSTTTSSIEEIGKVRLPSIQSLEIIKQGGTEIRVAQNALLDANNYDPKFIEGQYNNIAKARETYQAAWKVYEPLPQTEKEAELWNQFVPAWTVDWKNANDAFFEKVRAARALDLGNPCVLLADLERFRGDHYLLEVKTLQLIQGGTTFSGGDDAQACAFGQWAQKFSTTNPQMKQLINQVRDPHKRFHDSVARIKQLVADNKTEQAMAVFQDQMLPAQDQVFSILDGMREQAAGALAMMHEAAEHFRTVCLPAQAKANDLLDQIVQINDEVGHAAVTDGVDAANSAKLTAVIAVVIGVLLAMAFGVIISRAITKPVLNIVARIKDIAQGEGDLTQRVDENSTDEIGELAKWFNSFVQKVHDIIAEVAGATREVSSASTQIAASSEQMAAGMKQQTDQTTQVSSAVEEMSATVVEVARKSADAANSADSAGKQATEGGQVVSQTVEGMKAIADVVNRIGRGDQRTGQARRADRPGHRGHHRHRRPDEPAGVECRDRSGPAGEHGRGFAVVADEVRKLAERTMQATEEVATSIKAIQDETNQAVQRMGSGTERVTEGVSLAEQAGESLQSIVNGSKTVAEMIQSIAAAAEEQSAAAEQISKNVESINAVTRQSAEGADQAASAATQLSSKSEQLQRLVGQFKIEA
jgi:methyl-accepting chemotaxis protein